MIKNMVEELSIGKTAKSTKENGLMVDSMEKELSRCQEEINEKEFGNMAKELNGLMKLDHRGKLMNLSEIGLSLKNVAFYRYLKSF